MALNGRINAISAPNAKEGQIQTTRPTELHLEKQVIYVGSSRDWENCRILTRETVAERT